MLPDVLTGVAVLANRREGKTERKRRRSSTLNFFYDNVMNNEIFFIDLNFIATCHKTLMSTG